MSERLEWLPEHGAHLTRSDLERVFVALRALVANTESFDPNRSHVVEIAVTVSDAIEREIGGS